MSLNDRSKSILLQVAYKGVIMSGVGQAASLKAAVLEQFNMLVELHDELGLSPDDAPAKGRGPTGPARRTANVEKAAEIDAPKITLADGVEYYDFREQKRLKFIEAPNFPDFKTVIDPQKRGNSKWILFKGEPTEFAIDNGLV